MTSCRWLVFQLKPETENRKPSLPEAVARQLLPQLLRRAKLPGRQTLTPGRFHKGHLIIQEEDFLRGAPRLPDEGLVDGRLRLAAAHLDRTGRRPGKAAGAGQSVP